MQLYVWVYAIVFACLGKLTFPNPSPVEIFFPLSTEIRIDKLSKKDRTEEP